MKSRVTIVLVIITTWHCCVAPPVTKNKNEEEKEGDGGEGLELLMHYHRYLKEVVGALESDPEFKKKLEGADEADIRSGKIANELEFVNHHVRTRLDEIKRTELGRLRHLVKQQQQLSENEVIDDPNHGHLDRANPHTFEIEDLKKLIAKTTEDLAEADRKRREEFKQYELQKEYEKFEKLNHTNGEEKEKLEKEFKELENKHKQHQPLHQPGHKAQLEEVWEEQDHMQQEFDPKTFFMLHDLDSNGLWDQDEVKALFIKELDKMYQAGVPEDDMRERVEEMERMRETVFQEVDLNRDGFIDFHEFFSQTQRQNFQQDNGWKGLDEQRPYSDEELQAYIRQQQMMHPPPGYHHGMPPPGGHYPQGGYHPNQVPPGGYQGHPNQVPQGYQQHPNQGYQQHPNQGYPQHPNQGYQQHPQAQFQQAQQVHQGQQFQQAQPHQAQQFQQAQQGAPPLNRNEVYPNQGQQQGNQVPTGQQNYQPNQAQAGQVQPPPPPVQGQLNQNQGQPNYQQQNQGQANQPSQNQAQVNQPPQDQAQVNQPPQNQGQVNQPLQNQGQVNQPPQNQGQVNQPPQNQGQQNYQEPNKDQGQPQVQKL